MPEIDKKRINELKTLLLASLSEDHYFLCCKRTDLVDKELYAVVVCDSQSNIVYSNQSTTLEITLMSIPVNCSLVVFCEDKELELALQKFSNLNLNVFMIKPIVCELFNLEDDPDLSEDDSTLPYDFYEMNFVIRLDMPEIFINYRLNSFDENILLYSLDCMIKMVELIRERLFNPPPTPPKNIVK